MYVYVTFDLVSTCWNFSRVSAAEAAQYCDGVTPVAELLEMIASDAQALEHHEEVPSAEEGASSPKGSSFCVVS